MADSLNVFWASELAGELKLVEKRDFVFRYDRAWAARKDTLPISIRLPKREEPYGDERARPFFANLLPEARVRELIAAKLGISADNDFGLLEELGGECAGALALLPEGASPGNKGEYEPISPEELRKMIEALPARPLLTAREGIRLSLAGAQNKLPVFIGKEGISLPKGAASSSHILKPPIPEFPGTVINETFCMRLAQAAELPVPSATVLEETALLVERYDREEAKTGLRRLHQEDFCQALGFTHGRKYQAEGGPALQDCFALLSEHSAEPAVDKGRLLKWVVFNTLVGNCDGHAKNLSLLYMREGIRLAPFYDLMSTRIYPGLSEKLAMKIGGENRTDWLMRRHWERLAIEAGVAFRAVRSSCLELARALPEKAGRLAAELTAAHGGKDTIGRIVEHVEKSAARVRDVLESE